MKQTNPENQQTTSSPESAKEYGVGGETEPENDRCGGRKESDRSGRKRENDASTGETIILPFIDQYLV